MSRATPHHGFLIRVSAATFAVSVLAGLGLAHLLRQGDWRTLVIALVFVGAGVLGLQVLRNWRLGIVIFFTWIVVEDLIRKYLGNRIILYGAKDVLIVLVYVSFLFARMVSRCASDFRNPIRVPLMAVIGLALAECFNPHIEHPLIPLIGLRMFFLYVPLLYLGYAYFDAEERVRRFLIFALGLGGGVAALGVLQAVIGLDFLNPEGFVPGLRLELIRIAPESQMSVPRPTSVFVDAGRFAQYLFVLFFLGFGALSYWQGLRREEGAGSRGSEGRRRRRSASRAPFATARSASSVWRRHERVLWIAFGMITAGLIVSAQRAALVLIGGALLILSAVASRERLASWIARLRRAPLPIGRIMAGLTVALFGLALFRAERLIALYRFCVETLSPAAREAEVVWRPRVYWADILLALRESRAFGHGTGTASLGLTYLYGLDYFYQGETWSPYRVEGGYASVIWEWGIIGVVFWIGWTVALLWASWRVARRLRGSRFFGLALALVLFLALLHFPYFFLGLPVYQNYVTNAYHWFLCGLLFRLPKIASGEASESSPP
jgi:hypothetical protein